MGWFRRVDCSLSVEEALKKAEDENKGRNGGDDDGATKAGTTATEGGMGVGFVEAVRREEDWKSRKLYPERGGEKYKASWMKVLFGGEGREGLDKLKCERNVYKVIKQSHLVRLMMDALNASGCAVDIRRHISCEVCDPSVTGGYDPYLNQVVVCQNSARSKGMIQGVLTHEMIHMFDYCRHKMDLKDIRHLACTEIRAANLAHCSFASAMSYGTASLWNIKQRHQECVKSRAVDSVLAVRDVTKEEARAAVDEVFDKCYGDLEPVGRRIRRNSDHIRKAYGERKTMGYI